ncbi:hypothetical protein B0H66DRAFT_483255 [Apodospora peruviana]|uniref:Uncharacterized protein n=1 Tax=Apodospora peruviana TaxID=516989 RepID=A0AAE0HUZ4_9PEZI|nr:hypothetical protein B0H66DRAFT_483255 [Apodospora peruviana]
MDSPTTISPTSRDNAFPSPATPAVGKTTANSTSTSTDATSASTAAAPPGFRALRRSATVNEGDQQSRRRSWTPSQPPNLDSPFQETRRRRSSTFSDYNLGETRRNIEHEIINPGITQQHDDEVFGWWSFPLALVMVPAIAGALFKNGSPVVTDIILLILGAIFLNWTVTWPWAWYRSAQQTCVREETIMEMAVEVDSGEEDEFRSPGPKTPSKPGGATLDDVPEENQQQKFPPDTPPATALNDEQAELVRKSLNQLYRIEIFALLWCFAAPLLGACFLHAIRSQLSRPAEGLVSDFNLTLFTLAAELRPCSQMQKLAMARTLHLKRIVEHRPKLVTPEDMMQAVLKRLEELEAHAANHMTCATGTPAPEAVKQQKNSVQETSKIVREVRSHFQPDLDALNRAVRRYEKKATVFASQTESRMKAIETRMNDAIALAAAAAKNSQSDWSVLVWVVDRVMRTALIPFQALVVAAMWPFNAVARVIGFGSRGSGGGGKGRRGGRRYSSANGTGHMLNGAAGGYRSSGSGEEMRHRPNIVDPAMMMGGNGKRVASSDRGFGGR